MNEPAGHPRFPPWLLMVGKLLIVAIIVWFVRGTLMGAISEIRQQKPTIDVAWLVLAGFLYLFGTLAAAVFWKRILHQMGQDPRWRETLRAFMIGHLGKYVPGKAMVMILRIGLLKGPRVDAAVLAFSVFLETLTMMAVGAGLSALILVALYPDQRQLMVVSLIALAVAGIPTFPPVLRRLVKLVPSKARLSERVPLERVTYRLMAFGWFAMIIGWVLLGLSMWAVLRSLNAPELYLARQFPLLIASVAVAMVAGFATPIPGGLGVRELVLAQLVAPTFGDATAVISSALLRVVWLLSEVIVSVILYYAFHRDPDAEC